MSTAARVTRPPKPTAPDVLVDRARRFTVEEYHRLGAAGILGPKDRCELIRGFILEKPVTNPPHTKSSRRLVTWLVPVFAGPDWVVGLQQPITLADSEPEPDFYAATGPESKYDTRQPRPKDVVLVVEVSDTSIGFDRGAKLALYAENKIAQYWIIDVNARRVEVYTDPRGGKSPGYRTRAEYAAGDDVPVAVAGRTLGSIPTAELLP
jgi:Uma2 family endonuclease